VTIQLADWSVLRSVRTLAETDEYLVLDKPPGISVTGERHETDLVRIARAAGEHLIPVHRIDKVTSGAVLLA
jgi:tRNA pseudouridine32 synthase/23S rRNA pseudouridine746 synthase/23S rRNA pseudouridine1911/1915/1917 synthase